MRGWRREEETETGKVRFAKTTPGHTRLRRFRGSLRLKLSR